MTTHSEFRAILDGLKQGESVAAEAVAKDYFRRLVALVRGRLGQQYQARIDPEDIANSALKSFFRRHTDDPYPLTDAADLWKLLAEISLCKCRNRKRAEHTLKRDVTRTAADADAELLAALAPGPDAEAVVTDLLDTLTAGLSAVERRTLDLTLQGYTGDEIGTLVSLSERQVKRIRRRFREKMEHILATGEAE